MAERHRDIAESPKRCDEGCLLLIFHCHLDMMITRISIQETQTLTTRRGINDLVNARESKRISRTRLVKVCAINTHTPSVVLLKHKYRVSQPLRVKKFNDEPGS
jgi:hypothetical protein